MSNLENVIRIHELITMLTQIDNAYKLTNICAKLVRMSFEYIKKLDKQEILIIPAYENCVKILSEYANSKKEFKSEVELITMYANSIIQLEKINLKKYTGNNSKLEDYDDVDFIN